MSPPQNPCARPGQRPISRPVAELLRDRSALELRREWVDDPNAERRLAELDDALRAIVASMDPETRAALSGHLEFQIRKLIPEFWWCRLPGRPDFQ